MSLTAARPLYLQSRQLGPPSGATRCANRDRCEEVVSGTRSMRSGLASFIVMGALWRVQTIEGSAASGGMLQLSLTKMESYEYPLRKD